MSGAPAPDRAPAPPAHGPAVLGGRIRSSPGHFRVVEELGFDPEGDGPHAWLRLRKTGANTAWLARRLAGLARVPARDVGYSGLKDRHAVTEQWFSLPADAIARLDPARLEAELSGWGAELLERRLHRRKLRRGSHVANLFRIVVADPAGDRAAVEARLEAVRARGVPNYFGGQRFGREDGNLALARRLAAGERLPREQRGYALSAARSEIFNRVLALRVGEGSWDRIEAGDVAGLEGSGSVFPAQGEDPAELARRCAALDLHPTGPLWGRGEPPSRGRVRELETGAARAVAPLAAAVEAAGMEQARRHLRVVPRGLEWAWEDEGLVLGFRLPAGAFATTVLAELGALDEDASGPA